MRFRESIANSPHSAPNIRYCYRKIIRKFRLNTGRFAKMLAMDIQPRIFGHSPSAMDPAFDKDQSAAQAHQGAENVGKDLHFHYPSVRPFQAWWPVDAEYCSRETITRLVARQYPQFMLASVAEDTIGRAIVGSSTSEPESLDL
jgi:hypothetical protein